MYSITIRDYMLSGMCGCERVCVHACFALPFAVSYNTIKTLAPVTPMVIEVIGCFPQCQLGAV